MSKKAVVKAEIKKSWEEGTFRAEDYEDPDAAFEVLKGLILEAVLDKLKPNTKVGLKPFLVEQDLIFPGDEEVG